MSSTKPNNEEFLKAVAADFDPQVSELCRQISAQSGQDVASAREAILSAALSQKHQDAMKEFQRFGMLRFNSD